MTKIINAADTDVVSSAYLLRGTHANIQLTGDYDGTVDLLGSLLPEEDTPVYTIIPLDFTDPTEPVLASLTGELGPFILELPRDGFGFKAQLRDNTSGECTVVLSADVIKTI